MLSFFFSLNQVFPTHDSFLLQNSSNISPFTFLSPKLFPQYVDDTFCVIEQQCTEEFPSATEQHLTFLFIYTEIRAKSISGIS